jgi:HSP20 family protein
MASHKRSNHSTEMISLRDAMDRLFAESFIAPRAARNFFSRGSALANLYESPDSYDIEMPLPGAKPKDVTVTAEGDTVTLKWETKTQLPKDAKQVWSGMQYGTFQESLTLPAAINADAAEATLSDGMLSLHLPKADSTKATTIQIKSEQPQKKIEVDQAS